MAACFACNFRSTFELEMSIQFKKYKRIFRRNLQPLLAVLAARRRSTPTVAWMAMVNKTMRHIINNPVEYLGEDLPPRRLIVDILDEVQTEFIKEMAAFGAVPRH